MYIGDYLGRREIYSPDKLAIIDYSKQPEWRLTYRQWNERVNRLATWLRDVAGVNKGDRVAIRENEHRARMLGYNTFYFKLVALIISGITAALAGALHAIYQPIVSPVTASLVYTVNALLIILVGGIGTLSGALVGAAVFRSLQFFLDKIFAESSSLILGMVYVAIVLFVPYGIVGTWHAKKFEWQAAWRERWAKLKKIAQQ